MTSYKRPLDYSLAVALMAAIIVYSYAYLGDPLSFALTKVTAVPLFLLASRSVSHVLGGDAHSSAKFRLFERHALYGLVWGSFWVIANWSHGVTVLEAGRFFAAFFVAGLLASIVIEYTMRQQHG